MKFEIQSFPTLVVVQRNQAMHYNKETFGIDESMQAKSNSRKELFEYYDYALGTKGSRRSRRGGGEGEEEERRRRFAAKLCCSLNISALL